MALTVKREEAVAVFLALGFSEEALKSWSTHKLTERLNKFKAQEGDDDKVKAAGKAVQELFAEILAAVEAKNPIEVDVPEDQGDATPPPAKPKKGKTTVATNKKNETEAPAKGKKGAPTKDDDTPKDRFGAREGTKTAKINKVLGPKPLTMKQILEKAGMDPKDTCYNHLRQLMEKGHVIKEENAYRTNEVNAPKAKGGKK